MGWRRARSECQPCTAGCCDSIPRHSATSTAARWRSFLRANGETPEPRSAWPRCGCALSLIPAVVFKDSIALTAAIVLVVSFLVGPFVQQASRTAECCFTMDGVGATIPYAHFIPRDGGYNNANTGPYDPSANSSIALLSAVTAPQGVENGIVVNCPTGNCTFSAHQASISSCSAVLQWKSMGRGSSLPVVGHVVWPSSIHLSK